MIAETGMLAVIATAMAAVAFIIKALDSENETAFKALNLLAAAAFAVVFFLENATIAMYTAIIWAIVAILFFFFGQRSESPLKGWNEELWQSHKAKPKRKRKPREKKPENGTPGSSDSGSTPIWPWG